jgi:hypothetical protein
MVSGSSNLGQRSTIMAKKRGRKKLTVVGPHLGGKHKMHKGGHKKHGGRKRGRRK